MVMVDEGEVLADVGIFFGVLMISALNRRENYRKLGLRGGKKPKRAPYNGRVLFDIVALAGTLVCAVILLMDFMEWRYAYPLFLSQSVIGGIQAIIIITVYVLEEIINRKIKPADLNSHLDRS